MIGHQRAAGRTAGMAALSEGMQHLVRHQKAGAGSAVEAGAQAEAKVGEKKASQAVQKASFLGTVAAPRRALVHQSPAVTHVGSAGQKKKGQACGFGAFGLLG